MVYIPKTLQLGLEFVYNDILGLVILVIIPFKEIKNHFFFNFFLPTKNTVSLAPGKAYFRGKPSFICASLFIESYFDTYIYIHS